MHIMTGAGKQQLTSHTAENLVLCHKFANEMRVKRHKPLAQYNLWRGIQKIGVRAMTDAGKQ